MKIFSFGGLSVVLEFAYTISVSQVRECFEESELDSTFPSKVR